MPHWISKRTVLTIVLIAAAGAVVAMGARGGAGLFSAAPAQDPGWMRILGAILLALGILGFTVRAPSMERDDAKLAGAGMITVAVIMTAIFVAGLQPPRMVEDDAPPDAADAPQMVRINPDAPEPQTPPNLDRSDLTEGISVVEQPEPPALSTQTQPDSPLPNSYRGFGWSILRLIGQVILGILILTLIWIALRAWKGTNPRPGDGRGRSDRRPQPSPHAPRSRPAAAEALRYAVRDSQGPARKIVDAYHHLIEELSRTGAPRRAFEAPHEHLDRTLGPLGAHSAPIHRLADLYVAAQFSERTITESDWQEAEGTLQESLAILPETDPVSGSGRSASVSHSASTSKSPGSAMGRL